MLECLTGISVRLEMCIRTGIPRDAIKKDERDVFTFMRLDMKLLGQTKPMFFNMNVKCSFVHP